MASKDGSREKPPVKLVIKKEALSPTKNHSKKVSPLSPSKNVSIKQELKSPYKTSSGFEPLNSCFIVHSTTKYTIKDFVGSNVCKLFLS
ncbi:hypothetical protein AC249_AIPGENE20496 [Exaiptasia diaphana]|nr:hypothetical protein AC249_AIPGENE20496 [Exaiptasia diaphana]